MKTDITVFIPVYNGANFIERAIQSVLCQTHEQFKLVISDNCSTDETMLIASKYLHDKRVLLVQQSENVGMAGNFRSCLDGLSTKYHLILCHDDMLYSDKALETGVNILDAHPDIPAVYCETMFIDKKDKSIAKRSFNYSGIVENNHVAKDCIISGRNLFGVPLLVRSSAVSNIDFDPNFFYTGDIDYSITFGKNRNVFFVKEPLIAIRFHAANNTARNFMAIEAELVKMAKKYGIELGFIDKVRMKLNHICVHVKKYVFYLYLDKIRG